MAINHTGHNHPATTAARQRCRKAIMTQSPDTWTHTLRAPDVEIILPERYTPPTQAELDEARTWARGVLNGTVSPDPSHVDGRHCQACGSTAYEDLELGDQGYTACCNEPVVSSCDPTYCYHK